MERHRRLTHIVIAVACILATAAIYAAPGGGGGGGGKPGSKERPVTTTILDVDATGGTYLFRSDSPTSGTQVYSPNSEGVVSKLMDFGEFEFSTLGSTARKTWIDLSDTAGGVAPVANGFYPARMTTYCGREYSYNLPYPSPASMKGLNTSITCPGLIRFDVGADYYRLYMEEANGPGTDRLKITCTRVSGEATDPNAPCTGWRVEPSGADGRNYVYLVGFVKAGKKVVQQNIGYFYTSFRVEVTEP